MLYYRYKNVFNKILLITALFIFPNSILAVNTRLSTTELTTLQTSGTLVPGYNYWDTTLKVYKKAVSQSSLQPLFAPNGSLLSAAELTTLKDSHQVVPHKLYWNTDAQIYEKGATTSSTTIVNTSPSWKTSSEISTINTLKSAAPGILYWNTESQQYFRGQEDGSLSALNNELDTPTCNDGEQNGDETGIDCGGSCPNICATCNDGILNGDEEKIDCGGQDCTSCPDLKYLIDFGRNSTTTPGNWNNLDNYATGQLVGLVDDLGETSNISLSIAQQFQGRNNSGYSTIESPYPNTAKRDSFYFRRWHTPPEIVLSDLDTDKEYSFTFYASRRTSRDRTSIYTINDTSVSLNAAYNNTNTVSISNITPEADGTISISMTTGENASYGYLNVLEIVEHN